MYYQQSSHTKSKTQQLLGGKFALSSHTKPGQLDNPAQFTQLRLQIQHLFAFHIDEFHVTSKHDAIRIVQILNSPLFSAYSDTVDWRKQIFKLYSKIRSISEESRRKQAQIDPEVSQKEGTEKSGIAYEMKQRTHEADNNTTTAANNNLKYRMIQKGR